MAHCLLVHLLYRVSDHGSGPTKNVRSGRYLQCLQWKAIVITSRVVEHHCVVKNVMFDAAHRHDLALG